MKSLAFAASLAAALTASALDLYVFTRDGVNPGSQPREIPSAGMVLATRETMLGLHSRTPQEKASCGWYRWVKAETNPPEGHYYVATGHVFNAESCTCTTVGKYVERPKRPMVYSKLKVYTAIATMGKWPQFEEFLRNTTISNINFYAAWQCAQELSDENAAFEAGKQACGEALGLTQAEVDAILANCVKDNGISRAMRAQSARAKALKASKAKGK